MTDIDRIESAVHNTQQILDYRIRTHDWDNEYEKGLELDSRMHKSLRFKEYLELKREFDNDR